VPSQKERKQAVDAQKQKKYVDTKITHSDKRKIFQQEIYEINSAINVIEPLFVNNFH